MRDNLREHLTKELTRKQFLQYMGTVMLMVLGLNNLISLFTGNKPGHSLISGSQNDRNGFGTRKFGV